MNEHSTSVEIRERGSKRAIPLDAQLAELIEVVWSCEVAARQEDRIDTAIRYRRG